VIGGGDWKSTANGTTAKPVGLRVVDTLLAEQGG